jgi:hypothetical protein
VLFRSGSFKFDTCTKAVANSCSFNGQTIPNGQEVSWYLNSSVPFGASCVSKKRKCVNGAFDGDASYAQVSCVSNQAQICKVNNVDVAHEQKIKLYQDLTRYFYDRPPQGV